MRISIAVMVCAALVAGCDSGAQERQVMAQDAVPPPAELPPGAGPPPERVPRPPICPPFPPGTAVPANAASAEQCAALEREQEKERAAAEKRQLAEATRDGELPPFGQRVDRFPERGSWMQRLVPDDVPAEENGCSFTEKPRSERPANLVVQAQSGNMDLLAEGFVLAHDHAIGFVEAGFLADKPVIAVRKNMPDLWIAPKPPIRNVILRIGAEEFRCIRSTGSGD